MIGPKAYIHLSRLKQNIFNIQRNIGERNLMVVVKANGYGHGAINIASFLSKNSAIILVKDLNEAVEIANKIAPEHLEIITNNSIGLSKKITNAGAIFLGKYSPEAIGDYIAGPSHCLPTLANARFSSGLSVFDFLKRISIINCSKEGFDGIAADASILANIEGFDAHKLSVDIRKKGE